MSNRWKELHIRALKIKTNDSYWLKQFAKRIPRYTAGCKCKEHWAKWVKANPPTFGEKYFEWTIKAHNSVNKRLGKKEYTVEEARTFYQQSS